MENKSVSIGNRVLPVQRPTKSLIEKFQGLPSSNIGDIMNRLYCLRGLRPMNSNPLCGCAFTVKVPQGDNLMIHYALDLAQPGDIICVDGEGDIEHALAGEMMLNHAVKRGIGGWVIDGSLRDSNALRKATIPIFCRNITPQGPYKNGPGEINVPISCGGQVVFPGDILVGDDDGVVVVRPDQADTIASMAREKFDKEQQRLLGKTSASRDWVFDAIRRCGTTVQDLEEDTDDRPYKY